MSTSAETPEAAPPDSPPPPDSPAASAPKGRLKPILLGLVGLLVVAGSGLAIYYYVAVGAAVATRLPVLARSMPKDVQFYAEVPNVLAALHASKRPVVFDRSAAKEAGGGEKSAATDPIDGLAGSFGISRGDAEAVIKGLDAVGIAARNLGPEAQVAVVVGFRDGAAAKKLLSSKRFTAKGDLGTGGKRYSLTGSAKSLAPFTARGLFDELDSKGVTLMWHESAKLLAIGDEKLLVDIAAVISEGKPSLEKQPLYTKAKAAFDPEAVAVAFFDPAVLVSAFGKGNQDLAEGYLKRPGPYTVSLALVEAGMRITAKLGAAGNKLPDIEVGAPAELTLPAKLTRKTLAYSAFSTRIDMKGAELIELLQRELEKVDPGAARRLKRKGLKEIKDKLGVSAAEIIDAVGDEGVLAVSLPETPDLISALAGKVGDMVAITYAQRIKDKAVVSKVLESVRGVLSKELASTHTVRPSPTGFVLEPVSKGVPAVELRVVDDLLIIVGGNSALASDSIKVLTKGGSSLADEPAHELAMESLPKKARLRTWFDLGRMLAQSMKLMPAVPAEMRPVTDLLKSIRMAGDQRLTSAMSVGFTASKQVYKLRLDSLNMVGVGAAFGIYGMRRYLASAKSSEAKNTIGAISRGARGLGGLAACPRRS